MSTIFVGNVSRGVGLYFHVLNVNMKPTGEFIQILQKNISVRWRHSRQATSDTSLTKLRFYDRKHGSECLAIVGNDVKCTVDHLYV